MRKAFIIHGAYGNPDENWLPWLRKNLEILGWNVIAPEFPTPEGQNIDAWLEIFSDYKDLIERDSIFIGHSLGVAFILNILERLDIEISATYFVSGFTGLLGIQNFDHINKSFVDRRFDWNKIRGSCRKFKIFHSDNDPYVPLKKSKELAVNLGSNVMIIKKAGHFNKDVGYETFDKLLEEINKN